MKIGKESSVFVVLMFFVAFINGSLSTWFYLIACVFAFLFTLAFLGKLISKVSSKDKLAVTQFKEILKGDKPDSIENLNIGNLKEVLRVWNELPQSNFKDKEKSFNSWINAGDSPTNFAVAQKALYETKLKPGAFMQARVSKEDIYRPLTEEERPLYKTFSVNAQQNLVDSQSF